ncbi:Nn.00g078720.m01.CDS01 [Neocucurbitaria sp. VM-36]
MKIFSYESWGVPQSGFDPSHTFVRSHFVPPVVLGCIRALLSIYSFTTIITCYTWLAHRTATISLKDVNIGSYTIQQSDAAIGQSFSFFTYLTFWSLGFYFLASSIHTFMYAFRQRTWLHQWPKPLQLAHSLYYSGTTSFPFLVTIVFWGTMNSGWPSGRFEQWINISVHALNSLFAIVEIILPATQPPPWTHLCVVLGVLSTYLGLAYLTRETQGFYVYEWMNPAHGNWSIVLHIAGYAGGMIALFVLARYAIVLRNVVAEKMGLTRKEEGGEMGEKGIKLDNGSDTWSSEFVISRPVSVRSSPSCSA